MRPGLGALVDKTTQAGRILNEWAQLPISREEFYQKTVKLQQKYFPSTQPLPGVPTLLQTLFKRTDPRIYLALATSSHAGNFKLKTGHLDEHFSVFAQEHRVLGDDKRIPPGRGKPAPDIYLLALETINLRIRRDGGEEIQPAECLVFEDSVPGVEAGRRAGMRVVWCPHPELLKEYKGREEDVLAGRTGAHKEQDEKNEAIGVVAGDGSGRRKGAPGEIGDGWARLLQTLEDFPYESYDIHV